VSYCGQDPTGITDGSIIGDTSYVDYGPTLEQLGPPSFPYGPFETLPPVATSSGIPPWLQTVIGAGENVLQSVLHPYPSYTPPIVSGGAGYPNAPTAPRYQQTPPFPGLTPGQWQAAGSALPYVVLAGVAALMIFGKHGLRGKK